MLLCENCRHSITDYEDFSSRKKAVKSYRQRGLIKKGEALCQECMNKLNKKQNSKP